MRISRLPVLTFAQQFHKKGTALVPARQKGWAHWCKQIICLNKRSKLSRTPRKYQVKSATQNCYAPQTNWQSETPNGRENPPASAPEPRQMNRRQTINLSAAGFRMWWCRPCSPGQLHIFLCKIQICQKKHGCWLYVLRLGDVLRHVCTFCKQTGRKSQTVPRSYLWLHFIDPKHTKTKAPSLQCLDAEWQHAPSAGWVNRKDATSHGGTGGTRPYQRCRTASAAWIKECLGPISNIERMRAIAGSLPGLWPRDLGFVHFSWAMHGHAGLGMAGPILVKFWFQSPLKCFGLASFATTKLADCSWIVCIGRALREDVKRVEEERE